MEASRAQSSTINSSAVAFSHNSTQLNSSQPHMIHRYLKLPDRPRYLCPLCVYEYFHCYCMYIRLLYNIWVCVEALHSMRIYSIEHFFFLFSDWRRDIRTQRIASSKTCLRPSWVRAEHSTYLKAFNSSLRASPTALVTHLLALLSFRKSILVPTRMNGTPGAWCWISANHLLLIFSKDVGLSTEKHIKNTFVFG